MSVSNCTRRCIARLSHHSKRSIHQSIHQSKSSHKRWARLTGLAASLSLAAFGLSFNTIQADEDVFTDARPERGPRQFTSSHLYPHPVYKGITIATAESLPELVDQRAQRNTHVLLEIYSPYCHACERLAPIMRQVGEVASQLNHSITQSANQSRPSLTVAVMDDSRNHKPGFLTRQEERYLPLIKLYPANSNESFLYEGPHNTMAILRFINSHLPEADRIDMKAVEPLVSATNDKTQDELVAVYEKQRKDEIANDPTISLFDTAPCGNHLSKLMQEMILGRYRSIVTKADQTKSREARDELMKEFNTCVAKNSKETVDFWKKIADLANGQLDAAQKGLEAQEAETKESKTNDDSQPATTSA